MQANSPARVILIPRRAFISTLVLLSAAILAFPVLADHIGPHRTVTTFKWERLACQYEAVYDPAGPGFFACTLTLYEPPDGSCPSEGDVAGLFNPTSCVGWPGSCTSLPCDISSDDSIQGCSEGQEGCRAVEKTSELPPATVSGSISCSVPGSGGWCRGGGTLSISGDEPLDGESIVSIEGTRNGESFACSGASCSVPLLEGGNSFTFWARSSYGDTSNPGSAGGSLDSAAPSLTGEVSGTGGEAGWFVSEATVSASASDSGSGLASLEVQVDGGGWSAYSGPIVLGDGEHTVDLQAVDVAGNTAQTSQSVNVDTLDPEVSLSAGSGFCPGCGETLAIDLSVDDAGSGVAAWTLVASGVEIASGSGPASETLAWDGSGLGGGAHTLTLEARDEAGNAGSASASFELIVPTPVPDPPTGEPEEEAPPPSSGSAPTTSPSPTPEPTATGDSGLTSSADTGQTSSSESGAEPTSTPLTAPFAGLPAAPLPEEGAPPPGDLAGPQGELSAIETEGSSTPVFGAAALALVAAASAAGLSRLRKRQKERAKLRKEMAERNQAAAAREEAQRISLAAAAAAVAAAEAADRIARRQKVNYELAQHMARLEHLGLPPTDVVAAWQDPDPDLAATQLIANSHLAESGQLSTGQPSLVGTGTPPAPTTGPEATATPTPPGSPYQPTHVRAPIAQLPAAYGLHDPDLSALQGRWIARGGRLIYSGVKLNMASAIQYTPLDSGLMSVSAPSYARGTRAPFLSDYGLRGGPYRPSTVTRITGGNLVSGVFSKLSLGVGLGTSIIGNVWDFTAGSQQEKGLDSQEFYVSTGVDFAMSVGVGLASAATVAGLAALLGVTLTASAGIAAAAVVGVFIGIGLDAIGVGPELKRRVNDGFDALPGIVHNGQIIAEYVGDRVEGAAQEVASTVSTAVTTAADTAHKVVAHTSESVRDAAHRVVHGAQRAVSEIGDAARDAADSASRFIGKLFGGGD